MVTLTADADPGWTFSAWSGDLEGTSNPATITIDGDKTVTAIFVQEEPLPPVKITITPHPATITLQQSITYTATAEDAQGKRWDVTAETGFSIQAAAKGAWSGNVYTAGQVGDWTVTGTYAGLSDAASLTVEPFKIFVPIVLVNH